MEPVTINPLSQKENIPNESLTLEQAEEKMNDLLLRRESNAWEIGDLLNTIERRGLAQSQGYGKTRAWLEAKVPRAQGKTSALYRYADVAANYTKEQTNLWGTAKLNELIVHDRKTEGRPVPSD